jgi:hypothetical protein
MVTMDMLSYAFPYTCCCHRYCRELQGLVTEGRGVIAQTIHRNQELIYANASTLQGALQDLEAQAKTSLRQQLDHIHAEFDTSASLLSVLEQVALADSELVTILGNASAAPNTNNEVAKKGREAKKTASDPLVPEAVSKKVLFQAVGSNTADYQMLTSSISPVVSGAHATEAAATKKKGGRHAGTVPCVEGDKNARAGLDQLEIARLYKIVTQPALGFGSSAAGICEFSSICQACASQRALILCYTQRRRVRLSRCSRTAPPRTSACSRYCLRSSCSWYWPRAGRRWTARPCSVPTQVFVTFWQYCSHVRANVFQFRKDMISSLYGSIGTNMNQTLPEEYASVLQADGIDDNTLLHIKNTHEGTSLNGPAQGRKGAGTGGGGAAGITSNATRLSKLQAAMASKLYLVVW